MKKFTMLVTQTIFILSALYLIASVGAVMLDWLLVDYVRVIAFTIVNLYITGRVIYREML
jgi:hypothetical protein